MNKNILKISILIATSLWASQLLAGSVTIPNTFVSGAAASASEVNANFSAIKAEVDDNDSRITTNAGDINANAANIAANTNAIGSIGGIGVLVDGVRVGSLLQYPNYIGSTFSVLLSSNYVVMLSGIGEGPYPQSNGGVSHEIVYLTVGCTGQAYVKGDSVEASTSFGMGQIYANQGLSPLTYYYIPTGTTTETLTYNSKDAGFGCVPESATVELYETFLNDSNVTGVTGAGLIGTITLGN